MSTSTVGVVRVGVIKSSNILNIHKLFPIKERKDLKDTNDVACLICLFLTAKALSPLVTSWDLGITGADTGTARVHINATTSRSFILAIFMNVN